MDSLQLQITSLNEKVEDLYQIIERLSGQIAELLQAQGLSSPYVEDSPQVGIHSRYPHASEIGLLGALMEHKDVLLESNGLEVGSNNGNKELAPEVQIQRLTAQLTAAYNRIAALEEQLLARRVY